ncbi:hypothetical protein ACEQ8H_005758 [Pleosporales sp. CAS-2024a]
MDMSTGAQPHAYALLESHFSGPLPLRPFKQPPRRSDEHRTYSSVAQPLLVHDDDTGSAFGSPQPTPLEPPATVNGADVGLPPTPPTMSQDGQPAPGIEPSSRADAMADSLQSKQSLLSTPVNARSPPTPDPSPPRTATTSTAPLDRPHLLAYPSSSRAESFRTAREDASSEPSHSRSATPLDHRLSTVDESPGLGLAFEVEENDTTPTDRARLAYPYPGEVDTAVGADEDKEPPLEDRIPDREWTTDLMRNVTLRRKRTSKTSPTKQGGAPPIDTIATAANASPSPSPRPRRASGLRERVEASTNSPVTPSMENFAQTIGWPRDDLAAPIAPEVQERDESHKRNSTSSMASSRVEASIIVTPPRRRQTLRHSGKNMAYRDGSPTPDRPVRRRSNRDSSHPDDVPLHRLVHKKVNLADRSQRFSIDSTTLGIERSTPTPLSFRSRIIDSSAATLAHQASLRNVLQPAADILSRASAVRYHNSEQSYYRRIGSAPEAAPRSALSSAPRNWSQHHSPPTSPRRDPIVTFQTPPVEQSPTPSLSSPRSLKRRQRSSVAHARNPGDFNQTVSGTHRDSPTDSAEQDVFLGASAPVMQDRPRSAMVERVQALLAARNVPAQDAASELQNRPQSPEDMQPSSPTQEYEFSPPIKRGPRSLRRPTPDPKRHSLGLDRTSASPEIAVRPSLDGRSTEDMARPSFDWKRPSDDHGRVSFDRSTVRTEEHGSARHLFASTTPFSQISDTPIEVSEATAVSIFPHNNHSLLVVQQGSRVNSLTPEPRQLLEGTYLDDQDIRATPTPPFVDASEEHVDEEHQQEQQPTLTFEPSTPPMQIDLAQPDGVDSPLKNPRPPPEPPKILFIPPTPAEELEKQLVPGPPKRSGSHPQRRLSLVQRARRYSDNLLPTLLSRATNNRSRHASDSHRSHQNPQVPSVSDENGQLHPFWRPRGFWDGFDDDSESESEDELHPGGDTSDVETLPDKPKRANTLSKRLTSGFRGSGGFLIGNSLGVERHGTNRRRHHITLPPNFAQPSRTLGQCSGSKVVIHPPTIPLGAHGGGGIQKRQSLDKRGSLSSLRSHDLPHDRTSWRQGRSLPGLKKYQVQYIGLRGVKQKIANRRQEKRRDKLRQSIGTRFYVPNASDAT